MIPEFSRPLALDRIGPGGLELTVEADAAECSALAVRLKLPAVISLACDFRLVRQGRDVVWAHGVLRAHVTQVCAVSLEEFDAPVQETFEVRFVPVGEELEEIDPEAEDEIPFEGNSINLGEAAAEQLGLAIDPYPRMPGVEMPANEDDAQTNPFAVLQGLARGNLN